MPRPRKRINSGSLHDDEGQKQHQQKAPPVRSGTNAGTAGPTKKRQRLIPLLETPVQPQYNSIPGQVLTLGEGDTGQLGLGDEALSRKRPARVEGLPECGVLQAVAGGMHTACLTADGRVFTFGCNDENALGRPTADSDGAEYQPGPVSEGLPDPADDPVVHLSAGDSHTVAATRAGRVYIWGTFRDSNGVIGLTKPGQMSLRPVPVTFPDADTRIVKTASGASHVICLTSSGRVYTFGCGEQGQLGRVSERSGASRGGRAGLSTLLTPREIRLKSRQLRFDDVWAGAYVSFARSRPDHHGNDVATVLAWGLNNFYQLGIGDLENRFFPTVANEFNGKLWLDVSSGQHHTVALDSTGRVYACGRGEYGRLGRGGGGGAEESSSRLEPVSTAGGLGARRSVQVACATACGYCVSADGAAFAWGMGSNKQLGHGEEDADAGVPGRIEGKQLAGMRVIAISGGGQHAVLLAVEANNNNHR